MNAYNVVIALDELLDTDDRGAAMSIEHTCELIVVAPSRGKARAFVVRNFELDEFTYPMSITIIEKDVPIGSDKAMYPEEAGYGYRLTEEGWARVVLEAESDF